MIVQGILKIVNAIASMNVVRQRNTVRLAPIVSSFEDLFLHRSRPVGQHQARKVPRLIQHFVPFSGQIVGCDFGIVVGVEDGDVSVFGADEWGVFDDGNASREESFVVTVTVDSVSFGTDDELGLRQELGEIVVGEQRSVAIDNAIVAQSATDGLATDWYRIGGMGVSAVGVGRLGEIAEIEKAVVRSVGHNGVPSVLGDDFVVVVVQETGEGIMVSDAGFCDSVGSVDDRILDNDFFYGFSALLPLSQRHVGPLALYRA